MSYRKIISQNPYTGEIIKEFSFIKNAQLNQKIELSNQSYQKHRNLSFKERTDKLLCLSNNLDQNIRYYAEILTQETGKPIKQAEGEIIKSSGHAKFYAKNLERFLKQDRIKTEAKNSGVYYHPLGVIYMLIPFNYPFWLTFKSGIPILSAGNTLIMRNSDSTPIIGEELEKLFRKSGFDNNEFQNLHTTPDQLNTVMNNKHVQGISFTGSTQAGRAIAGIAGQNLKKSVLELGGSDPFIVCQDADLDLAADFAVKSRLLNNGQTCISAKRFIINHNVMDKFKEKLIEKLEKYVKTGDPMEETVTCGPMARFDLKQNIEEQVQKSIQHGTATVIYENKTSQDISQNFYGPVVLELSNKNNILFQEETFGPVFPLLSVKNDQEALQIANESEFGLGGAIFSKDENKAEQLAKNLDVGMVYINDMVKSDSRLPSGGCKASGFGRECGEFGLKEFVNIKSYSMA